MYLILLLPVACTPAKNSEEQEKEVKSMTQEARQLHVPDRRVGVFDVEHSLRGREVVLKGATTSADALNMLTHRLTDSGYAVKDSVRLLPDEAGLGIFQYGVVRLSVCNLHAAPDFSSEMVTQAVMGTPVRVLDQDNWYRVQTPDNYIAWVHRAGIEVMDKNAYNDWVQTPKVVVTDHYGFVHQKPGVAAQPVSDVVAGSRLALMGKEGGYYKVNYPDGRVGYMPQSMAQPEDEWRKNVKQDARSILQTAHSLMGVPYLWAGMSSKGMDCSGFVRNVLYMHDIIMPRDASQQIAVGTRVEIADDFGNLKPGDLVFFGRRATAETRERVVHVAIYIGNKRFIHSQGDVRIGSFDPTDALFDEFNLNRLLFATRFLDSIGEPGINTTATNPYYKEQ